MILRNIPVKLKELEDLNDKIYYRGDLGLLDRFKIAIVGSRRPNPYTKSFVYTLASKISKRGGVVVSGGAMGTDSLAHEAAGRNTIGVFANSLDLIYPKTSRKIIEKIYKESLAISEYPETTEARPYYFVQRNRIVTGLSDIVVVAQADLNSGSMRSAEFARLQEKPLYVLPHRIGESDGTNYLLEKGLAKPIVNIEKFLEEIGLENKIENSSDEILEFCKINPTYEEAFNRFGVKILEYELEGKVKIESGSVFTV